jgi:hypothetical protein
MFPNIPSDSLLSFWKNISGEKKKIENFNISENNIYN